MRVWIIGLDGATFDLLGPLAREGVMPNLAGLMLDGVSGPLESTIPPVTPVAWSTFSTGMNPGNHGVFGFATRETGGTRKWISRHAIRAPTLWHRLSQAGRAVGVMNVPVTYPAEKVHGFLIPGFLTPRRAVDFAHPPGLLEALEKAVGSYIVNVEIAGRNSAGPLRSSELIREICHAEEQRWRALLYCVDRFSPDLVVAVFMGLDKIQHLFWKALDSREAFYHTPEGRQYRQLALPAYRQMDELLGLVRKQMDARDVLFVISDHGFGPLHAYVDGNSWLRQQRWLHVRQGAALRRRMQRRLKRRRDHALHIPLENTIDAELGTMVDWSRTYAFAGDIYEQGFLLHHEAFPDVESRQLFSEKLRHCLESWMSPDDGQPLVDAVYRREEIYHGPYATSAPDFLVVLRDYSFLLRNQIRLARRSLVHPVLGPSGYHRRHGVFVAVGGPVRRGERIEGIGLADIAPTTLHLLGLEIPRSMDGRVLQELCEPEYQQSHPARFASEAETVDSVSEGVYSDEDEAEIEGRLRSLGYL
jgi:predicted AlkP superfamily phosphohydrolase/phosphomutase